MKPLRVVTWNLLHEDLYRLYHLGWRQREPLFVEAVGALDVDLLCLQEIGSKALQRLHEHRPGHRFLATNLALPDDADDWWEALPVGWRAARFACLDQGVAWLSDTPDVPSTVRGSRLPTVCTWARLHDRRADRSLVVASTHWGHGRFRRRHALATRRILDGLDDGSAMLLGGDFNAPPWHHALEPLRDGGWQRVDEALGVRAWRTLHLYGWPVAAIDGLWFRGPIRPRRLDRVHGGRGGQYVSDHFGLVAEMAFT